MLSGRGPLSDARRPGIRGARLGSQGMHARSVARLSCCFLDRASRIGDHAEYIDPDRLPSDGAIIELEEEPIEQGG
jgi:hypothetical protein